MNPVRRRRLLRALATLGLLAGGGVLLLAFAPLPVGWAVNAFGPDTPQLRVRVTSATLRLRPFSDGPTLDVRGLAVDQDGRPLARIRHAAVATKKQALFGRRIAALVEGEGVELQVPPAARGAKADATTKPPDVPALLARLAPMLAADARAVVVELKDIRILLADTPAAQSPGLARFGLVLGPGADGRLAARVEVAPAGPRAPVLALDLGVDAACRRAVADLVLPAAELADLAALVPGGAASPVAGRLAARVHAEVDLVALTPLAAWLEVDGDALRPAVPHPLAPPPATLRLRLRATENLDGLVAETFSLIAPGLDFSLPRLVVTVAPGRDAAEVAWNLRLATDPATAWPVEAKRQIAALPTELAALAADLRGVSAEGQGAATLRLRDGAWGLAAVAVTQRLEAKVGPTTLRAEIAARQAAPDAPVTVSLTIPEVNPAAERAEGDRSPLAAFDFPFGAKAEAALSPGLGFVSGRASVNAGPGRLRPVGGLKQEVSFDALELAVVALDASHVTAERLRFTSGDTRVNADGTGAELRDDGRADVVLRLEVEVPRADAWAAFLPPQLAEALKPLGWGVADVGIEKLTVKGQALLAPDAPKRAEFATEVLLRARLGEGAVTLELDAKRESADGPVKFSARVPRCNPSGWPGRPNPALAWADLKLPVTVAAEGHLTAGDFAPHVRVKVQAGPGTVLPSAAGSRGAAVAIEDFVVEAVVAGDPAVVAVPKLGVRLARGLTLSATEVRLDLRNHPVVDGNFEVGSFGLADALALWPETVEPELRARAGRHLRGGRVERLTGRIGVDLPATGAPVVRVADVDVALADLAGEGPELPWPVSAAKLGAELRWPRVVLRAEGLHVPGADVKKLEARVADILAKTLVVASEVEFAADLAALPKEAAVPAGYAGRVSGTVAVEANMDAGAGWPETAKISGRADVVDLRIPNLGGGAMAVKFAGTTDAARKLALTADADFSADLAMVPAGYTGRVSGTVAVEANMGVGASWPETAKISGRANVVDVRMPNLGGGAMAVKFAGTTDAARKLALTADADFSAELAMVPAGYTGRVSGTVEVEGNMGVGASWPETAKISGRANVVDLRIPDIGGGAMAVKFSGTADAARKMAAALEVDGSKLAWTAPELRGLSLHPDLKVSVGGELDAELKPKRAEVAVTTPEFFGPALALKAGATWAAGKELPGRVELAEFAWGRTRLAGDYEATAAGPRVALRATLIDVAELWGMAQPRLVAKPVVAAGAAVKPKGAAEAPIGSPLANLAATFAVERVDLGGGRIVRRIEGAAACGPDGVPRSASLAAAEGEENHFVAKLATTADGRTRSAEVLADDVPRWAGALATPFRGKAAPGELAPLVGHLETVAALLAGGALTARATLPVDQTMKRVDADIVIRDATLVSFPKIVQLLALKSGNKLKERPLVRELRVGQISLDGQQLKVGGVLLVGSGLIDRLKVNTASYSLDTQKITVDGSYFGVGFEVDGTSADPHVWLKDNMLIRAVGQTSDLDFGN